jgi:uncharacterized protein YndB with AHSA1/START domain
MTTIDRTGSAQLTLPSDHEILVTRKFDAPAELVFDVWTKPEHVRNWWGWERDPMIVCEIDLRVGGKWRYVSLHPEHGEVDFYGEYLEIDPPNRLVATEVFAPYPDHPSVNTLTIEEEEGVTTVTILGRHDGKQSRDAVIASGMEGGLQHSLDRVDRVLAQEMEKV